MNKEIVGKNLLDKEPILTGNGLPKIIGITENQYYEYEKLQQENKQLKKELDKYKKIIYICNRGLDKMQELEGKSE